VTLPTDEQILMTREFDAPKHLVYKAWTTPELVRRWWAGRRGEMTLAEVDLRVGGRWRFVSRGPGGAEMGQGGVYREIVPVHRLVYTEEYDDQWFPGESLVRVALVEIDGRTTMTTHLSYASAEIRDNVLRSPMQRGVGEGFARLDTLLRTMEAQP
jgi:uncharacterized protein YndB with AHSA1/START domain